MPQRGDVVVFRLPRDHNTQYLKRRRPAGRPHPDDQGRLSINGALVPIERPTARSPGEKRTVPTYVEKLPARPATTS